MHVILIFEENSRMVLIIELERCVTVPSVFGVVVGKFRNWLELCPVVLLPIYEDTKVCFSYIYLSFRLPVCLRVKCDRESFLDAKEITEQSSKFRHKNRFAVTNDRVQEVVISHQHVNNYFCQLWSVNSNLD